MDKALYLEILPWDRADTAPDGPPRLLIGDAALCDIAQLRFDLTCRELAPSPALRARTRAQAMAYWHFAEQYTLELDTVAGPLLDYLCGLARRQGLTLLVAEARTGAVVAGYLRDWAARTPPIERRLDSAWHASRAAAIAAANAADAALVRVANRDTPGDRDI